MTTLETLRDALPDYARDLKLNLGSVLAPTGAPAGETPSRRLRRHNARAIHLAAIAGPAGAPIAAGPLCCSMPLRSTLS